MTFDQTQIGFLLSYIMLGILAVGFLLIYLIETKKNKDQDKKPSKKTK